MKIVLVTQQYFPVIGGITSTVERLAKTLISQGHICCIIAPAKEGMSDSFVIEDGVTIMRLKSFAVGKEVPFRFTPGGTEKIYTFFLTYKPDIVHVHTPILLSSQAMKAARSLAIPVVGTCHVMPENLAVSFKLPISVSNLLGKIVYPLLVHFYNRCDYVTSPTATALQLLRNRGLVSKSSVISNGIDIDKFKKQKDIDDVFKIIGCKPDRPILLYFGRVDAEKHIDVILKAFAEIYEKVDAQLVIAGTARDLQSLKSLAQKLGISKKVFFPGYIEQDLVVSLYSSAYMYVIASTAELQSLATLEAFSCGLPVVAANACALKDTVTGGYDGFLFEPGNHMDMAKSMLQILRDEKLAVTLADHARETAIKHDIRKTGLQFIEIYKKAIKIAGQISPENNAASFTIHRKEKSLFEG